MVRLLYRDNFASFFREKEQFIASRHEGYCAQVTRIRDLASTGRVQDVDELLLFLKPWNIVTEGNWMGREWLRLMAMQALCYTGVQFDWTIEHITRVLSSEDLIWKYYDADLCEVWKTQTDSSCLADPEKDFSRCVQEVISCIKEAKGTI